MSSARTAILLLACLASCFVLVAMPAAAAAVEELPQEMVDPVDVMEPQAAIEEPVVEVPAATPRPAAQAQGAAQAVVTGVATGTSAEGADREAVAVAGAATVPTNPAIRGGGSLPFTGIESGRLAWLFLVASLMLCSGVLARAWSSAAHDAG